jgi:hypothetical protein
MSDGPTQPMLPPGPRQEVAKASREGQGREVVTSGGLSSCRPVAWRPPARIIAQHHCAELVMKGQSGWIERKD